MSNKIQIQYESLDDIAFRVGKSSDEVEALLTKARLCMTMMDDGAWIGRGSDKYRAEMEGLTIPALRKLMGALADLRYGMLRAGDTFRDAEHEAVRYIERLAPIQEPSGNMTIGVGFNPIFGGGSQTGTIGGNQSFGIGRPPEIGSNFDLGLGGNQTPTIGGNPDFSFGQPPNIGGNPDFSFGGGGNIGGNPDVVVPDPRIPDIFPIDGGQTVPRPDWFTQFSEDIDGFTGALNGNVLLIDGGNSPAEHMGNIVGESTAGGGVPVSGLNVPPNLADSRQAERAASAVGGFLAQNPNAQVKLSPGLQNLINGIATDSSGRSLMDMPSQAQLDSMRQFVEILRTTAEAFGRVIPGL